MNFYILALIVLYSIPLYRIRYKFRSTVYRDKSFYINFKPVFIKDIISVFSNRYFRNKSEIKMANLFRLMLIGYVILWVSFFTL